MREFVEGGDWRSKDCIINISTLNIKSKLKNSTIDGEENVGQEGG